MLCDWLDMSSFEFLSFHILQKIKCHMHSQTSRSPESNTGKSDKATILLGIFHEISLQQVGQVFLGVFGPKSIHHAMH
jgi:hypothetical protein